MQNNVPAQAYDELTDQGLKECGHITYDTRP